MSLLFLKFFSACLFFSLAFPQSSAFGSNETEQCVKLWETVARNPWKEGSIDRAKADEWVAAHGPEFRDAAQFVIDTLRSQTISHAEFLLHLETAVKKFETAHPSDATVLLDLNDSRFKSLKWVTGAVFSRHPELKSRVRTVVADRPVSLDDSTVKVIFEDVNITGYNMRARLGTLAARSNLKKVSVVFAMSNRSAERILRETCPRCIVFSGDRDILSLNERLLNIPEPRRSELESKLRKMFWDSELDAPLVITSHRLSDSIPDVLRKGRVFAGQRNPSQQRIPFLIVPSPPYRTVPKPRR